MLQLFTLLALPPCLEEEWLPSEIVMLADEGQHVAPGNVLFKKNIFGKALGVTYAKKLKNNFYSSKKVKVSQSLKLPQLESIITPAAATSAAAAAATPVFSLPVPPLPVEEGLLYLSREAAPDEVVVGDGAAAAHLGVLGGEAGPLFLLLRIRLGGSLADGVIVVSVLA